MFAPQPAFGGMTSNQVRQPMQAPQQAMQPGAQMPAQNLGMQQMQPGAQGIDPRQLAKLRALLMLQQQAPSGNLRNLLGL